MWPLLDRLVAKTIRAQFGGRLRLAVSGGAALSQPVARCFLGLGLPIVQGYGMTETSPIIAANAVDNESDDYWFTVTDFLTPTSLYLGTIGKPILSSLAFEIVYELIRG